MTDRAGRPATLGDVASLAGVSPSTVSNVVRGSDVVAAATRRRVQAAIDELAYRPNALARQLLQGRATTIGVIARDLANPFFAEMASLVEREVARFGFAAMLCATDGDDGREEQAIDLMLENRVSGLVFLSFLGQPSRVEKKINGQVPVVFVAAEEPWADSVTVGCCLSGRDSRTERTLVASKAFSEPLRTPGFGRQSSRGTRQTAPSPLEGR